MSVKRSDKTPHFLSPSFWLGSDQSAVNINRFWLYLGAIGFGLCAVCLVRAIETIGNR